MPRMAKSLFDQGGAMLRLTLAALMVLVMVWTTWQALRGAAVDSPVKLASASTASAPVVTPPSHQSNPLSEAEIQRLVAEVAVVCPASAVELERELTAAFEANTAPVYEQTALRYSTNNATRPTATITSIRVAQRPMRVAQSPAASAPAGDWLVDPKAWYAPEDAAANARANQGDPPAAEVAPAEVATPEVPVESTPETTAPASPIAPSTPDQSPRTPPPATESTSRPGEPGPSLAGPGMEPAPSAGAGLQEQPNPPAGDILPEVVEPTVDPTPAMVQPEGPRFTPPATDFSEPPTPVETSPAVPATPAERVQPADITPEQLPAGQEPTTRPTGKPLFAPPVITPPVEVAPPVQQPVQQPEQLPVQQPIQPQPPVEQPAVVPSVPQQPAAPLPPPPAASVAPPAATPNTFAPPARPTEPSLHAPAAQADRQAARAAAQKAGVPEGVDPHLELVAEGCFPSAKTCAKCHEKIYNEWSCSSHAYANISPMFQKFEQRITEVSQGTVGYFCLRCHAPVGTTMSLPRDLPVWKQPAVSREGITCVACHRVNQRYAKSNGERRLVPGDEFAPIYGGKGGVGVAEAIAHKDQYKVKTSADDKGPGQNIHTEGRYFDQIARAEYCTTCHQVAVHPGIKLEVVWEQYRASPAYRQGITCQDCHMGKVPGLPSGYECCAIAEVGGKKVRENVKHSNHVFYGPGYSIAHPGVFPFHVKADRWTMPQWLEFDWRAGWGTDEFEDRVADDIIHVNFPEAWKEADDRYDAREIIEDNLKRLAGKTELRKQIMENGSHVDGPFFDTTPTAGQDLNLHYVVTNSNTGHNLPTASLGAQPQLWANIVLIGPNGQRLWETGYTDQYGDVCDIHSRDVRAGIAPFDSQLFNLQTMFLITGSVGTDREFYLPVNVDFDQLPFLRPGATPVSVTNHPPFIRMESRALAPLGKKKVNYRIPGNLLCQPGRYRLSFRMRSRAEPIYFMDFCRATTEMKRGMNEGMIDVHPYAVEFDVR